MAKLVSKTYGDAMFELAKEENRLDDFYQETRELIKILDENEELIQLMTHPQVLKEEKIKVMEEIFHGRISAELVGLFRMMVEKDRFGDVRQVLDYFIDQVKEEKQIGTAYVTSAMDLTQNQKDAVEKRLLETTKYETFEMHYDTDATLIGGMVIRIGDRVVDSSIRTKLDRLTAELSKIQLKVGECAS